MNTMIKAKILIITIIGLAQYCLAAPTSSLSAPSTSGRYYRTSDDRALDCGDLVSDHVDALCISRLDDLRVRFAFVLYGPGAHHCQMEGTAIWRAKGFKYRKESDKKLFGIGECVLTIEIRTDRIILLDHKGSCQSHYCGARATIDGKEFTLTCKRALVDQCLQAFDGNEPRKVRDNNKRDIASAPTDNSRDLK